MAKPPKYDAYYKEGRDALGPQFEEVAAFFAQITEPCVVLDIGAGQGRDALPIARAGHRVLAVDISGVGLRQLAEDAAQQSLDIQTIQMEIEKYEPGEPVDILLADRTFHMIPEETRLQTLGRLLSATNPGARALIIDEASNIEGLATTVASAPGWRVETRTKSSFTAKRDRT